MSADSWNGFYKDDPSSVCVPDRVLESEVEGLTAGTALDLGCGVGENVIMLAHRQWSVVGVDWSEEAIRIAKEQARHEGVDATFVQADLTSWTPPREFDLVVSTYALPGGRATTRTLATAIEAMRPGGTIIVLKWAPEMCKVWGAEMSELLRPDQVVAQLPGISIDVAETRTICDLPKDDRFRDDGTAFITFVRGHRDP